MWGSNTCFALLVLIVCSRWQGGMARTLDSENFPSGGRQLLGLSMPSAGKLTKVALGASSYFTLTLSGSSTTPGTTSLTNAVLPGYCIDLSHFISFGSQSLCVAFCSSIDPNFATCLSNIITANSYNNLYTYQNMDQVNWIINNYAHGQADGESGCGSGASFTKGDIQAAIWSVTQKTYTMCASAPAGCSTCRAQYIATKSAQLGKGFVPDKCWQQVAIATAAYTCGTAGTPLSTMVQTVIFYTTLKDLGFTCSPWPKCTVPQLPSACIGVNYATISQYVQFTGTLAGITSGQVRNLTCAECHAVTGSMPAGCECPVWPCCGPNVDPLGYNCPPCPAVALTTSFSKAIASSGGCATAVAWISGGTVGDYSYKVTAYDPIVKELQAINPAEGATIGKAVSNIANIMATAISKATIRYYQYGCVCATSPGFSETKVKASVVAVASAVAQAYAAAVVSVFDTKYAAYVAFADAEATAIAGAVSVILNDVYRTKLFLPGQCSTTPAVVETSIRNTVATALACTVAESVASAYYYPNGDPLNPTPLGSVDSCSCSVSLANVAGSTAALSCPTTCPVDAANPALGSCKCANGYDPTQLGCAA